MRLPLSLNAWGTPEFAAVAKREIAQLDADLLPLQQGLAYSSHAIADSLSVVILGIVEEAARIRVKAGLFHTGIIAGCSCADDPTPVDEIAENCVARFDIDRLSGEATVELLDE
jgi:hypothetical protein